MSYIAMKTRLNLPLEQRRFLRFLMRESRSLYNQALYNVRQHFFQTNTYLSFQENYHLLKDSEHFRVLNASQAQMVIRKVDEAMKAFFRFLKDKSKQIVRLPRYLKKEAYYPLFGRMVYLAEQEGVETRIVNEAYTSKASYMDEEKISKSEFSGRRLKRGLYQTKSDRLINADQNAALNMIQKGNPNAVIIGTKSVNTPIRSCLFGV